MWDKLISFFKDFSWFHDLDILNWKPENLNDFQIFLGSMLVLATVALLCFINIIGTLLSLYIIKYTELENKYPWLKRIVNYYSNINYLYILYQIVFLFIIYFIIIWTGVSLLYKSFLI